MIQNKINNANMSLEIQEGVYIKTSALTLKTIFRLFKIFVCSFTIHFVLFKIRLLLFFEIYLISVLQVNMTVINRFRFSDTSSR